MTTLQADRAAVAARPRAGILVCVTSTGFLTPGFSAHLIKELGPRPDTSRLDVIVKVGGFSR